MPKPKRRPKNTAVEEAGEVQKIVLSMPVGGQSVRTKRGSSDNAVGTQTSNNTSPGAKPRKPPRTETKSSDRVSPPPPRERQVAPQSPPASASRESSGARRGPSAAIMAIVACFGGIVGSLATIEAAKYLPVAVVPSAVANSDLVRRLAHIDSELAALKASIATSAPKDEAPGEDQSSSLPQGAKVADDSTGPMPDAPSPPVSTASSVTGSVVDGWILRNVSGGSALVEGRPGLIQVMPGDSLPGVGRVETIKREDGRWVVVTVGGLIVSR
jgi:hypothetical protein